MPFTLHFELMMYVAADGPCKIGIEPGVGSAIGELSEIQQNIYEKKKSYLEKKYPKLRRLPNICSIIMFSTSVYSL